MLQVIPKRRALALLSALVVVGMWSNAMAVVFCPHMRGSSDCCLMEPSHDHSHDRFADSGLSMSHDHMDHAQMADMDMDDMPMEAETQTDNASTSQSKLDHESLSGLAPESAPNEAITQSNESCSHCMMHSPSGASFPISIAGQSTPSHQVLAADAAGTFKNVAPSLAFVDLHDHSPPGSSAPLYVLVSAFRI